MMAHVNESSELAATIAALDRHARYTAELVRLVKQLDDLAIDYRVLKGIPLNQALYGNQLIRESRDIDLLIQTPDFLQVHQCLVAAGYQLRHEYSLDQLMYHQQFIMNYIDEMAYWHPMRRILIDLKWEIRCASGSPSHMWPQLVRYEFTEVGGCAVKTLPPAINYHYLCIHGAKHLWLRRQWLTDLAQFQKKIHFTWKEVFEIPRETLSIRALLEASCLLKAYFEVPMPSIDCGVMDKVAVKIRLYFVRSVWWQGVFENHPVVKKYVIFLLHMLLYPTLIQKCRYLVSIGAIRARHHVLRFKKPTFFKLVVRSAFGLLRH